MRIVITGANGFLGWHARCRLRLLSDHEVTGLGRGDLHRLPDAVAHADAVVHLAAVNSHGPEAEEGNLALARAVADAVREAPHPVRVVYADTVHRDADTPYGRGKRGAAELLRDACEGRGQHFVDVVLPNLFGEEGRPRYNSFVATFVDQVLAGEALAVQDRTIELLHAQGAAQALMDALSTDAGELRPRGHATSVAEVARRLTAYHAGYGASGVLPELRDELDRELFNTYRAALFRRSPGRALTRHADQRGDFVEVARVTGGEGQTSFSTTVPGVTRGDHVHLWKRERFCVVRGRARISLRRLLTDETVHVDVRGEEPTVVDIPTLWTHSITNTGADELLTLFWIDALYDPQNPDTYPEKVRATGQGEDASC